ncbi:hypothetical protein V6Z11_D05G314200 [Gossypium hirsutum]
MTNLGVIDPPSIEFDPTHDQIIDPIGRNIGETQIKLEQPNIQTSSLKISIPTYKIKPIPKTKTNKIRINKTHTNNSISTPHGITILIINITPEHHQPTKNLSIISSMVNNI